MSPSFLGIAVARSRRAVVLAGLVIAVAVILAYANSLGGPFVYDDVPAIPENATLSGGWRLDLMLSPPANTTVSGRPVLNLSFALNHAISGNAVWSYHATNVLIHALAALVLFGLVRRTVLLGARRSDETGHADVGRTDESQSPRNIRNEVRASAGWQPVAVSPSEPDRPTAFRQRLAPVQPADALPLAFAIALLWALHPLATEAIDYVVQRAESLMSLFLLLTLYCFARGIGLADNVRPPPSGLRRLFSTNGLSRSTLWFAASVVCCALGMATKENMAAAPLLVMLYDRTFVSGAFRDAWQRRATCYLALAATWLLLAGLILGTGGNRSGTVGFGTGVGVVAYWLTQPAALVRYLALSFWPAPLVFDYGTPWVTNLATVWAPGAVVLALIVVTLVASFKNRSGGFLGLAALAILAPTSLVPGVSQMIVEHRMYLPLAAIVTLAVCGAWTWWGGRTLVAVVGLAPALLGLTAVRNAIYRSEPLLWTDTAAKRPDNARAYFSLASWLQTQGRQADAIALYEKAIGLFPGYVEARNNLGNGLCQLGRFAEALPQYEAVLQANPRSPGAHNNVGTALYALGRSAEAIPHYQRALELDPKYRDADVNLGMALLQLGRPAEAVAPFEQAAALDPARADVQASLADALAHAGRPRDAFPHFEEALRHDPKNADLHAMYGNALADANRLDDALQQFDQAAKLRPDSVVVQFNYGATLLAAGRTADAVARFEAALRLQPDFAPARNALDQIRAAPNRAEP